MSDDHSSSMDEENQQVEENLNSASTAEVKKVKRKRVPVENLYKKVIILELREEELFNVKHVDVYFVKQNDEGEDDILSTSVAFNIREVRMKKTSDEIKKANAVNRKRYLSKEETKAKMKIKAQDPATKIKKAEYAKRKEVIQNKKINDKRRRDLVKVLKVKHTPTYESIMTEVIQKERANQSAI